MEKKYTSIEAASRMVDKITELEHWCPIILAGPSDSIEMVVMSTGRKLIDLYRIEQNDIPENSIVFLDWMSGGITENAKLITLMLDRELDGVILPKNVSIVLRMPNDPLHEVPSPIRNKCLNLLLEDVC